MYSKISSKWLMDALNSVADLILIKGDKSKILWANKAFLDYYGMTNEELRDLVDGEQSDPDDTLQYVKDDAFVYEKATTLNIPSEAITDTKGETSYFHTIKSPILDPDNRVKRTIGISRLIQNSEVIKTSNTDRKQVKENISAVKSLVKSMPSPMVMLDRHNRIVCSSTEWEKYLNFEEKKKAETFEALYPVLSDLLAATKNSHDPIAGRDIYIDYEGKSLCFSSHMSSWKFSNGEIGGTTILLNNITPLKAAQAESQISTERVRLATEASKIGLWDWDLIGNNLIWDKNMYQIYGVDEKKFSGAYDAWSKSLHPGDKERSEKEIQETIENGSEFSTEFRIIQSHGDVRHIRALARLTRNSQGEAIRLLGANWDITEQKNKENELHNLNEELQHFSYRTSHDLKAPLLTIAGLSSYIKEDINSGDLQEAQGNLDKIIKLANQLGETTTNILNITKSTHATSECELFTLDSLVEEIELRLKYLADEKAVKIKRGLGLNVNIQGPKIVFSEIIENLISNSIKYSNQAQNQKWVEISATVSDVETILKVSDNGLGIPQKKQGELFQMFKRFHPDSSFGSGLGAYLVKKHVDNLGGKIHCHSNDNGSEFTITLKGGTHND